MKKFENVDSANYIQRVTIVSAKTMIWASLVAFLLNGAWFFFDDFFKTLIQEIVILTATVSSIINLRLSRKGRVLTAIHVYTGYGTFFGVFVIWTAGAQFIHTGNFILALSCMMAVYALEKKQSLRWCVINFAAGAVAILFRYYLNLWGFEENLFRLLQMFAFNSLILGTLIFFSYRISAMLKTTLKEALHQKEEVIEIAKELSEKNEQLYKHSITDRLTGLNNRFRLDQVLLSEIGRAARYHAGFSVILFDIDLFKKVNDTYGHLAGDEVLKKISALVRKNIRSSDVAGRWGGEEFMIICPETNGESCFVLAEKIRNVMIDAEIGGSLKVTASFGVAEYIEGDDTRAIVKRVDDALYSAKEGGRNRTVTSCTVES